MFIYYLIKRNYYYCKKLNFKNLLIYKKIKNNMIYLKLDYCGSIFPGHVA